MVVNPRRKTIGEILTETQNAKTFKAKVEVLQKNESKPLRQILKLAFDHESYKWTLDPSKAPYVENLCPIGEGHRTIQGETKRLYMFLDVEGSKNIPLLKKEAKYVNMLQSFDAQEASLMEQIRLGKIEKISQKVVDEAFPDLLEKKAV